MLLLVMESQFDQRRGRLVADVDEVVHRAIDMGAVAGDVVDTRPREQPSLRSRVTRADGLVVRVEEERVRRIEGCVAGERGAEKERLEEPSGVGPMPLG